MCLAANPTGEKKTDKIVFCNLKKYFIWWILSYYVLSGAVASMFWVDAELGSDIYLDGKLK